MKQYTALFYMLFSLLAVMPSEARIPDSAITMGGISIGSTEAYLRSTYGKPKSMSRAWYAPRKQYVKEYNYGDSFFVSILEGSGTVFRMQSLERHNNIHTAAGITIGSSLQDVLRSYGYPDLRQIDGESDYYWYFGSGAKGNLVFEISYGKVKGITCGSK